MRITGIYHKLIQPEFRQLLLWSLFLVSLIGWGITAAKNPVLSIELFAHLLCGLVILIFINSLTSLKAVANLSKYNLWFIIIQIVFWSAFLLINYPGFYGYDAFTGVLIAGKKELSAWHSYMYSITLGVFGLLDLSLFWLVVVQVGIYLSCLTLILKNHPIHKKTTLFFANILCVSPLILSSVLYLNRDILFGLLSCYLMIYLYPYFLKGKTPKLFELIHWHALLLVTVLLRQDGKIYLVVLPVLFYMSQLTSKKQFIKGTIATGLLTLCLQWGWSRGLNDRYFQSYEFTAILQPLHYMVHKRPQSLEPKDMDVINKVISVDVMESEYTELYITLFHRGKYTLPVKPDEWTAFKWTYLNIILKNIDLFITQRTTNFLALLNVLPYSYILSNDFSADNPFFNEVRSTYNLSRTQISNYFFPTMQLLYAGTHPVAKYLVAMALFVISLLAAYKKVITMTTLGLFLGSLLLPITGLVNSVSYVQWLLLCPVLWFVACGRIYFLQTELRHFILFSMLFICSRIPVLFLAAPEPHMSYFSPGMILPILIALLALLRSSTFSKT